VNIFEIFHRKFPQAPTPNAKMLLIDQLIHAFHTGLTELGRPVAANLIQGSLKEVIHFLYDLSNDTTRGSKIGISGDEWRCTIENISWAHPFLKSNDNGKAALTD